MIRILLAWLAAGFVLAACSREEPIEVATTAPALWEIVSPDGERGWLFGTIHALPEGTRWQTPVFERAWDDSGRLVLEVPDLGDSESIRDTFSRLALSEGLPPVLSRVPRSRRPRLEDALEERGIDPASLAMFETWAVALTLSQASTESGEGVDAQLQSMRGTRAIDGLERTEDQLGAFDRLPEALQQELLLSVLDERDDPDDRRKRAEAWLSGDLDFLEAETQRGMLANAALREALLVERNSAWLPRVERAIATGTRPFIAVGTAHLLGPDGLPAQLAAKGYAIERVQ